MPAHSASKTRVNALMSRASTSFFVSFIQDVDGRDNKPGHDAESNGEGPHQSRLKYFKSGGGWSRFMGMMVPSPLWK